MGSRQTPALRHVVGVVLGLLLTVSPALAASGADPGAPTVARVIPAPSTTDSVIGGVTSLRQAVARIDQLVEADYQKSSITPNLRTTDEQFLRRVYLDVAGRIPTLGEAQEFLASTDPDKRAKLIDKLLDSPAFVSNMFNFYADLLRIQTRPQGKAPTTEYFAWVKQSLTQNTPYDKMVYQMLTAKGQIWEDGATGYLLRDSGMPLDNMANTVRIFLGTQIGCAQCHDHPFEKWTQHEFYEMAAYTTGTDTRARPASLGPIRKLIQNESDKQVQQILQRIVQVNSYGVNDQPAKVMRLPDDYKYKDGKPKDPVKPATIFGGDANITGTDVPRIVFARWLTDRKNPRFAPVIANRLWKRFMGAGLFEPVDDITDDTKAANQPLMAHLARYMIDVNFDTKQYIRTILNTQVYQRQASREEPKKEEPYRFAGPALRRLSAEQVWDSLLTLIVPDLDTRTAPDMLKGVYVPEIDIRGKTPEQVVALAKELIAKRGEMKQEMRQELRQERKGTTVLGSGGTDKYRGIPSQFVRASEWQSPANPGHFLRQFGQSDREIVDGAERDPSVMQALSLLNGPLIQQGVLNRQGLLAKRIEAAATADAKLDAIFLSVLSRRPTVTDRAIARDEIQRNPATAYQNIAWALTNTREFMFLQ